MLIVQNIIAELGSENAREISDALQDSVDMRKGVFRDTIGLRSSPHPVVAKEIEDLRKT